MAILNILFGLILLILGRRLFWVFVAIIGAVVAINLARQYFEGQTPILVLLAIALLAALLGALLAVFLQRVAIAVAGFLAGAYLTMALLNLLGVEAQQVSWLFYLLGGILVAVLTFFLFDWALIIVSSLIGASLIVQSFDLAQVISLVLFIVLFLIGITVQSQVMRPVEAPLEE